MCVKYVINVSVGADERRVPQPGAKVHTPHVIAIIAHIVCHKLIMLRGMRASNALIFDLYSRSCCLWAIEMRAPIDWAIYIESLLLCTRKPGRWNAMMV